MIKGILLSFAIIWDVVLFLGITMIPAILYIYTNNEYWMFGLLFTIPFMLGIAMKLMGNLK